MRLAVDGISKAFPGLEVLKELDLHIAAGEIVAILGPSGTGKSTLLNCLGLLDRPDSGTIAIDGQEVTSLKQHQRARLRGERLGFVFQGFHLLPEFTLIENVLMAARCAGKAIGNYQQRAKDLLQIIGLAGREDDDVQVLSGGERQRVALCRALLLKPALILADEPTGNLDPATATLVLQQMLDLVHADNASLVLVTHDDRVAARADRRLHLANGQLHPETNVE